MAGHGSKKAAIAMLTPNIFRGLRVAAHDGFSQTLQPRSSIKPSFQISQFLL